MAHAQSLPVSTRAHGAAAHDFRRISAQGPAITPLTASHGHLGQEAETTRSRFVAVGADAGMRIHVERGMRGQPAGLDLPHQVGFSGCEPAMRMSTNFLALCCQSAPEPT